jgi:hypothetical protein
MIRSLLAWATFKFILCDREEGNVTAMKKAAHEEGVEVTERQPAAEMQPIEPDTFHEEM